MNKRLAIVIPTYHRSKILRENFILMFEEFLKYSIPIYISDDSKDLKTEEWLHDLKCKYPYIFYSKNSPGLGHDKNLMRSIKLPDTDYVWLLGDSIAIEKGAISKILNIINQNKSDIIAINVRGRDIDFPSGIYCDHNDVLSKFGWHLTLTGATLFSKKAISLASELNFSNYRNFPQFSLIYHYLAENCSFHWINDRLIYSNKNKKSYWADDVFSVFIDDWSDAVHNLPYNYTSKALENVIINHSRKTNIFNVRSLFYLRSKGVYSWEKYKTYSSVLPAHSNLKKNVLIAIALAPRVVIQIGYKILSKCERVCVGMSSI
jgi:abequosyltransferase